MLDLWSSVEKDKAAAEERRLQRLQQGAARARRRVAPAVPRNGDLAEERAALVAGTVSSSADDGVSEDRLSPGGNAQERNGQGQSVSDGLGKAKDGLDTVEIEAIVGVPQNLRRIRTHSQEYLSDLDLGERGNSSKANSGACVSCELEG